MTDYYKMIPIIYPDSTNLDINKIKISNDLKTYIESLEKVIRFSYLLKDFPNIIKDNTKTHTIRCVYRAMTTPGSHPDLIRILWLHDIPEYTSDSDLSVVERHKNHSNARKMEEEELAVAKKIFNPRDLSLYKDFLLAEDFLRRRGENLPINQQTLVANVIDLLDGNLVFTYYIVKWLSTHDYKEEGFINEGYSYVFEIRDNIFYAIENSKVDEKIRDTIKSLLSSQLAVLGSLLKTLKTEQIPEIMRDPISQLIELSEKQNSTS